MSRNAVTLESPTGARTKCAAQKRYALAVAVNAERLEVILRTDNGQTAKSTGFREARKRNAPVMLFTLRNGDYAGFYAADGTAHRA